MVLTCISLVNSNVEYLHTSSLEKCLFSSFTHFLVWLFDFLMLSCMNCLYMLDINPLWVILFVNIFSHSVGCFFILSTVSFPVQKFLSLIRSHLFIFAFMFFASGDISKKYCYALCQRKFCLSSPLGVLWYVVLYLAL